MSESKIKKILSTIIYPNLDKSITELGLVDAINKKGKTLDIVLNIQNDESFELITKAIKASELAKPFDKINVVKKTATPKKSINYGNSANPNNRAPYAKKVIAVTSGKGGVGKSTVSTNLSIALAQQGYKIGLLDADVYGPNIPRMLGVNDEKLQWNDNDKMIPSENFGIKTMSVALTTPSPDTPLVWRSSVAVSALIQFLEDVEWGELDFLVIDMPPGTGDVQLTMAQELPIAASVIVTTPQMVAIDDVSRAIMMFKDIGVKIGGLVENMSYFIAPDTKKQYNIFGNGGGEITAAKYQIPFLGKIPLDMDIREKADLGMPPVAMADENIKNIYKDIASNLLKEL